MWEHGQKSAGQGLKKSEPAMTVALWEYKLQFYIYARGCCLMLYRYLLSAGCYEQEQQWAAREGRSV